LKPLKPTYKKALEWIGKLIFLLAAFYIVAQRIDLNTYQGLFSIPWQRPQFWVPVFLGLWLLNLILDGLIWQKVHAMLAQISFPWALKTNLVCYSLAFITPVNSGELAGRYLMITEKTQKNKTVFLTFWSHFPRLIAKLILGGSSALLLLGAFYELSLWLQLTLIFLLAICSWWIYINLRRIENWLSKRKIRKLELEHFLIKGKPEIGTKARLFSLASVKLLTYSFQFTSLLLMWSELEFSLSLFASVLVFFCGSALLPTIAIADFLVKGALAMLIFPTHLVSESVLLNATFVTWLFNIALPALAGSYFVVKSNWQDGIKKQFSPGNR